MAALANPILKNVETGQIIEVSKSPFVIGRSLTCDYVIEDNTISRRHCCLAKGDEGWVLTDSSMNGTVINEEIYHHTTSCVLKNNDEICLNFRSFAYKFLTESTAAPNPQVESVRSEGSVTPDIIAGISPASINSFDDNGISDDVLNNLADNIFESLEQSNSAVGNNSNPVQDIVSSVAKQCSEPNYRLSNILDPVELMLKTPEPNNTDLQQVTETAHENPEKSILRDLLHEGSNSSMGAMVDNNNTNSNEHDNSNGVMTANAEDLPSSGSTVIYASPGASNFNHPSARDAQIVAEPSTSNNNCVPAPLQSSFSAVPDRQSNNTTVHDSVERFKMHFDQTLDEVIRKYTVSDEVTEAPDPVTSANALSGSTHFAQTLDEIIKKYMVPPNPVYGEPNVGLVPDKPNTAVVSPMNVNKKVKVTLAAATGRPPVVATISYNKPGVMSESNRTATSRDVSRPVYPTSFKFSLTQPPPQSSSRISLKPCTVVVPEKTPPTVIDLTNSQYYLTSFAGRAPSSTIVSAAYAVPIGSTAIGSVNNLVRANNSGPAKQDIVDGTGSSGSNVGGPPSTLHNSQKPGTSKQPDEEKPSQLQSKVQNQYEQMEDELMCTICANLFIKAVTLGCSHSFCQYCIEAWKKKKSDCPICRNRITSSTRTLVLDNIIEKMLENATADDKKLREEAIKERQKIEEEEKAAKAKQNDNRRGRNTARRGRRNNARNNVDNSRGTNDNARRNNVRAAPQPQPPPLPPPPQIIQIYDTDNDTTTDSEDNMYDYDDYDNYYDGEWYDGVEGAYYGGYGHCYVCGNPGHWANGCPFR